MCYYNSALAGVMELADVLDSKSSGSDTVSVRPRSPAPTNRSGLWLDLFCFYAGVAELADALDLGSSVNDVGVQVPSPAPSTIRNSSSV